MSRAADSFNGDMASAVNHLFNFPETNEKLMFPLRAHDTQDTRGVSSIPVDILDSPKEYIFYMDVPGLSKSEIQYVAIALIEWKEIKAEITLAVEKQSAATYIASPAIVEDERTLVVGSNGKRKREDGEDEGCKCLMLERRAPQKLSRKFRLPENANVSAISAKCENGVLTVVVQKLPPPPKAKTVEVAIA